MRRLWGLILSALILAIALPASVSAQEEWCYVWTFDSTNGGWEPHPTVPYGMWVSGGWTTTDMQALGPYRRSIVIQKSLTQMTTFTYIKTTYDYVAGTVNVMPDLVFAFDVNTTNLWTFGPADMTDGSGQTYDISGTWTGNGISFLLSSSVTVAPDYGGSAFVDEVEVHGTGDTSGLSGGEFCDGPPPGELTRPLQPFERLLAFQSVREELIFGPTILANKAVVFAAEANAMVHAVVDGTITQIEPLTREKCVELFQPAVGTSAEDAVEAFNTCRVTLASEGIDDNGEFVTLFSGINNPPPAFIIHIEGEDGREYLQIATDVATYAYEGQSVSAGCWLGKALNLATADAGTVGTIVGIFNGIVGALIQVFGDNDQSFDALTAVWVNDGVEYINAWDEYTLDPSDSAPCNSPEGYEGCMGDTRLEDASQWQSSNGVSWNQPGALMAPGSYIAATYNLNEDRNPSMLVGAYSIPLGILALKFGDATDTNLQVLGPVTLEIEAGEPDDGEFYTVEVRNTGSTPVRIDFICVSHLLDRDGNPSQTPEEIPPDRMPPDVTQTPGSAGCRFVDSSFNDGLDEWTGSEDVEVDDGVLLLPDGETISQVLALPAGTYTLTVITQVWGTAAYEPDDDDTLVGIEIEYAYPSTSFTSMGTKAWNKYTHRTATFTASVVIASPEDEPFTFRAQIANAPTGVLGVQINSVCLTRVGQLPAGDGDGLIEPTCGAIPTPTLAASQPGTWFTWLWAHLNKFYRCELILIINEIYSAMTSFFRTALWSVRWTQAAAIRFGNYANSFLYLFNGHMYNVAVGYVYVVEGEDIDQAGDLGDVLLGGLQSVIELFVDLLQRVIDFVFYLLNLVFVVALDIVVALIRIGVIAIGYVISFMGGFFDALNALFFAWNNSEAQPIAGVPQCAIEPKENPVCIALWTLENTIFSGRGFLFIPFLVAYGSAELLLWAIAKLSKSAQDSAQGG